MSAITYLRTASRACALRSSTAPRTAQIARPFSSTTAVRATKMTDNPKSDMGSEKHDKKHVLEKGPDPNVQSENSKAGRSARASDTGGTATQQKDGGAKAKAKKDFPEAPDQIGFEDERGGKA
ncbi:uncharacterized protein SEPMUDRAFT_77889 [Sphaerulina musiva SO2202]|uniref:Uncharacterized protein n=1 Tax=Sphaerulina musiva (strain SO2202) TaxID=692275 RepID=N1QNS3_SPHMS|nr:uncharacterized protein SEPMUDRAFT_77889 [Sphaerulina musiva SO2202]EMF17529.1 hypothetical protein SEPMUDRAFT_77889 [Sphaerulina musiva SO2202]